MNLLSKISFLKRFNLSYIRENSFHDSETLYKKFSINPYNKIINENIDYCSYTYLVNGSKKLEGLKYTSRCLSFIGFVSTETEYRLGGIDENRRDYDHALNLINTRFPILAFGTIPGNYLGQRYHKEIVHEITDENTITVNTVSKILNFFGLPASKEEIKN